MQIVFITNLIYSDQSRTGVFAIKRADMTFMPVPGMEIEGLGLENARRVMGVSVDIDCRNYDAYVTLSDITCPTEEDFKIAVVRLRDHGWEIKGKASA
jgi:hypothetical protein